LELEIMRLKKAGRGDERAFEALMTPHLDTVYRVCLRLMGNEKDAEDCAQETLLRVWTSLSSFRGQAKFSTWVYRIAVNLCLDELRKRRRQQADSLEEMKESGFDVPDGSSDAQSLAEQKETRQVITRVLNRLSDEHRTMLVLRDVQGFSYEEIAEMLSLPLNTVKSRISRARSNFCKEFREEAEQNGDLFGQMSRKKEG